MQITNPNFEPSTATKKMWLYVRKPGYSIGSHKFPGLFEITAYGRDLFVFSLAIVLEIWSMFMILSAGTIPFLYQLALVVTAILIDLTLAIAYHAPVGKIVERKNNIIAVTLVFAANKVMAATSQYEKDIRRYSLLRIIPGALILIFAACKCVIYIALQKTGNVLTISVIVSYLLVAFIHLYFTGYAIFAFVGHRLFEIDENKFTNFGKPEVQEQFTAKMHRFEPIYMKGRAIVLKPIRLPPSDATRPPPHGTIAVEKGLPQEMQDANAPPDYALFSWGILTDRQLQSLSGAQLEEEARLVVAQHGIKQQLRILKTNPPQPGEPIAHTHTVEST